MLKNLGTIPLRRDLKLWPPGVMGIMDLVIDATVDSAGDHATASHFHALQEQGDLIFIGLRNMTDAVVSEWQFDEDMATRVINHAHALEVFDNWEIDLGRSKVRDLQIMRLITVTSLFSLNIFVCYFFISATLRIYLDYWKKEL
jgi:hypothetical protein